MATFISDRQRWNMQVKNTCARLHNLQYMYFALFQYAPTSTTDLHIGFPCISIKHAID